jgi:hypothetical protein
LDHDYTYFYVVLFWFTTIGVFLYTSGPHRKISVIAGVCYTCVLPLYLPFEDEYWSPNRFGGWILGIEDVLLLFVFGSAPWALVGTILGNRLTTKLNWPTFIRRYTWLAILGIGAFITLLLMGWQAISASVISQVLIAIIVLVLRRDLWPLAVIGYVTWTSLYLINLKVSYWLWPDFQTIWNHQNLWGSTIFGIPVGEILWASSYAFGYPFAIGYIVDAQLVSSSVHNSTGSSN